MQLIIKLGPPYCKPGEIGTHTLELEQDHINLQQLAIYLSRVWEKRLAIPLIDEKGGLTAEIMVNGKIASADTVLSEGDIVTVIPLICGG